MPISIKKHSHLKSGKSIFSLCDDSWKLPDQLEAFEQWLIKNKSLPEGSYSADIGFSPRAEALGGGGRVSLESMRIMTSIGMELYFSEYPEGTGE